MINVSAQDGCVDSLIRLNGNRVSGSTITQWRWWLPNLGSSFQQDTVIRIATPGSYPIRLAAINVDGCATDTVSLALQVYRTRAFAGNDTLVVAQQPFFLQGAGGVLYAWDPPTGLSDPTIPNPRAVLDAPQTYVLRAYTPVGCDTYDSVRINVFRVAEILMPNAFSPNGDGLNDRLRPIWRGIAQVRYFRVFNRYGQVIFETSDPQVGWDGTFKGSEATTGTYAFNLYIKQINGSEINKTGTITLVR
jgi:gliding motility-associated-like protein